MGLTRQFWKSDFISETETRSCGRFGPDKLGTTVDKSNSTTWDRCHGLGNIFAISAQTDDIIYEKQNSFNCRK
jgi:hypothetical protein